MTPLVTAAVLLAAVTHAATLGADLAAPLAAAVEGMGLVPGDAVLMSSGRTVYDVARSGMPTMPGVIHSVTVTAKAKSVLRSASESGPSSRRSRSTYSSMPFRLRISGLLSSRRTTARATNISAHTGSAMAIQSKNEIGFPVASSMNSRPIRLGGEPTGVSRPPTLAP